MFEDFADKVGQGSRLPSMTAPASVAATLAEAERRNPGRGLDGSSRIPFSLVFVADHPAVLPQRLYRIEHEALGALAIFLVPIAPDARGMSYQATFN